MFLKHFPSPGLFISFREYLLIFLYFSCPTVRLYTQTFLFSLVRYADEDNQRVSCWREGSCVRSLGVCMVSLFANANVVSPRVCPCVRFTSLYVSLFHLQMDHVHTNTHTYIPSPSLPNKFVNVISIAVSPCMFSSSLNFYLAVLISEHYLVLLLPSPSSGHFHLDDHEGHTKLVTFLAVLLFSIPTNNVTRA